MKPFAGFLMGGFESAGHRTRDGSRFDLGAVTEHDRFAAMDYARLRVRSIRVMRESARWHAVETSPWHYDFAPLRPFVRAARDIDTQVIWSLLDRGWPGDLDPFRPLFVRRFASFARAFARFLRDEGDDAPILVPVNEIATLAWLGGETARIDPYREERGFELQCQLVRAAVAAADAARAANPGTRICCVEPLYHVAPRRDRPQDVDLAVAMNARRFRAIDMLTGRVWPQLGGEVQQLDAIGVTFYPRSEWYYDGPKFPGPSIPCGAPGWRPLRELLGEVAQRYSRPLFVAGTGDDGARGPWWLRYVGREVRAAIFADVRMLGLCVNPILDCPRWPGERRGTTGLWSAGEGSGKRHINRALAEEIVLQQACFARLAESLGERPGATAET